MAFQACGQGALDLFDVSDLIGKEFEYKADGPDKFDCWTLTREVMFRAGYILPRWDSVVDACIRNNAIDKRREFFTKIDIPEPFCLVLFKLHPQYVTHIGTVLPDTKTFIHVMRKKCVCIERLDIWERKIEGFYKYNSASSGS